MKEYILIFLLSIFICIDIKETAKEDVSLSGGLSASQARLLFLTSRTHSIEAQLTKLSNEKLILAREQSSIQLYKKLALSQIENKNSEINNLIEQKKNTFKEVLAEYNQKKEEISKKEKELDIEIKRLNTELEEAKMILESIKGRNNKIIENGFKLFGN